MKLPNLFGNEKRAVSPVIGVILMVAITVILAAVIGTFVLGLGDSVQTAPQVSFGFDQNDNDVTITHRGGASLDADDVEVRVDGVVSDYSQFDGTVQTGKTVSITVEESSTTVSVVYVGGEGESILGSYDLN
ncbi:type IV pilin [Haloprofundus salilacus]|uniref:type IV pilin n=1 Tax=Haloprofundus salilacus TaxID=2876190 RepID=UPI001CCDA9C9|nr:type IV pilin N-terminal domain-containing protein [Haloprofundus salilacus]